jgi:hypothetical protein
MARSSGSKVFGTPKLYSTNPRIVNAAAHIFSMLISVGRIIDLQFFFGTSTAWA